MILLLSAAMVIAFTFTAGVEDAFAAAKLKVSPASKTIRVNSSVTLKANQKVKWSISRGSRLIKLTKKTSRTVKVKGVKAGTAYVKAKAGKNYKKIKITVVSSKAPTAIEAVSTSELIGVDSHCMVYVKSVTPSSASKDVTFTTSDAGVATVEKDGTVTGTGAGTVTITAASKLNGEVKGSAVITVVSSLHGNIKMTVAMTDAAKYPKGQAVSAWVPVPQMEDNQVVAPSAVVCKAPSAETVELTTDSAGNHAFHIVWGRDTEPADRTAAISYHFNRRATVRPSDLASRESGSVDAAAMAKYLKASSLTGPLTDGIVKETADKIVKDAGAVTVYQKADAVYNWVCDNLYLDKNAAETVSRDAADVLGSTGERYSEPEINAAFVALLRAAGVPARLTFGMNMGSLSTTPTSASALGCRVQFNLPGYGWVDANPCNALKTIAGYEASYRAADAPFAEQWSVLKNRHWGVADQKWVKLSEGEDVVLSPKQAASDSLQFVGDPYAEYGGQTAELSCTWAFEQDAADCGCE